MHASIRFLMIIAFCVCAQACIAQVDTIPQKNTLLKEKRSALATTTKIGCWSIKGVMIMQTHAMGYMLTRFNKKKIMKHDATRKQKKSSHLHTLSLFMFLPLFLLFLPESVDKAALQSNKKTRAFQ